MSGIIQMLLAQPSLVVLFFDRRPEGLAGFLTIKLDSYESRAGSGQTNFAKYDDRDFIPES